MSTLLINYADLAYFEAQKLNTRTGLLVGGLDRAIQFRRQHLDPQFCLRNKAVLNRRLGAGCWLWKPYLVVKTLHEAMADGDVLFYSDSGCHFVAPVAPATDLCLRQSGKPILLFTLHPSYANRCFEHRFDQSILSLLGEKYGIKTVPDISQWGNSYRPSNIPQIISHTRWKE